MINKEIVNQLVDKATELINKKGNKKNCTVAAAAVTLDGSIFTSLNFVHFSGGSCAEVALLARLASEGKNNPIAIVAVGDKSRGVVPPCGPCRQTLIDYYPSIQVVMPGEGGPRVVSISELLPQPYVRSANDPNCVTC